MNKFEEEAGDRNLYPHMIVKKILGKDYDYKQVGGHISIKRKKSCLDEEEY